MLDMIAFEFGRVRQTDGQVHDHAEELVMHSFLKEQLMAAFMDGQEKVLRACRPNHIGQHPKLETPCFVPAIISGPELERHDSEHNPFRHWLVAKKFVNLWMLFLNLKTSRIMGLFL